MLDLNFIRANTDKVREVIAKRGNPDKADIDEWLGLDEKRRSKQAELDDLNRQKNELAASAKTGNIEEIRSKGKELKQKSQDLEEEMRTLNADWERILSWIPNVPLDDVPEGADSEENVEVKAWVPGKGYLSEDKLGKAEKSGEHMPQTGVHADKEFTPKPHWEIGEALDMIDTKAAAETSGSRFYYLKGGAVLLVYATFNLLWRKLIEEGFTPMIVPVLVREKTLFGSSHFPGDADQIYKLESKYVEDENSLYLIGSSEPSNFAYFAGKTLDLTNPVKVMAQTTCFRSEVGSWGKDVRGIKRTHQFDKLEMNMICEADPVKAHEMHEYLLSLNEWLLQQLEIPYHVINMCTGDLGYYAAAKKYDIEFWTPSQKSYCEIMSNSITTDYQTRRLNIKYQGKDGKKQFAYTLNDTGVTHRILIGILEHYQQSDGTVKVPAALQPFIGKEYLGK